MFLLVILIFLILVILGVYLNNNKNVKKKKFNNIILKICLCGFFLLLMIFLYKMFYNKLYFHFTDYNYEIIVEGFDYNNYYIHVYDKKINVIKKEQIVCVTSPCNPIYIGEYEINFSNAAMKKIFKYVDGSFNSKDITSKTIIYNDIVDNRGLCIIKSIITNDESYLKESGNNCDYIITTSSHYDTLQNDGGSHINVYYQVNLRKNKIIKCADKYVGFKGYEYRDKIIYEKNINDNLNNKLKTIIEDLITREDINDNNNYSPYIIEFDNNKIEIYNNESIKKLENILNKIDNQ